MAEYSTPEERTEMPTDRRMKQLRKDGSVHFSQEIAIVISLGASFLMLGVLWSWIYHSLTLVFKKFLLLTGDNTQLSYHFLETQLLQVAELLVPPIAILLLVTASLAGLSIMLQTDFCVKEKKINFKWHMLNPITGFKRLFSLNNLVKTLQAILKLAIILPIVYLAFKEEAKNMIGLIHLSIPKIMAFTAEEMVSLFWKIMYVLIAIAIFDWVYGKWSWLRQNKMTKDEVKDEKKAVDGDEATKRQIIAKGLGRIMQRIKSSVPKADVVVTNPTHYAVALQYDRAKMSAPKVVAKGKNFMAEQIKKLARESGVPIVEKKSLARALYQSVEVDQEIPVELFRATAEVLAYVYKMNRKAA